MVDVISMCCTGGMGWVVEGVVMEDGALVVAGWTDVGLMWVERAEQVAASR
jgi:hypothetical protein